MKTRKGRVSNEKILLTFFGIEIGFFLTSKLAELVLSGAGNFYVRSCASQAMLAVFAIFCLVVLKKTNVLKFRFSGFGIEGSLLSSLMLIAGCVLLFLWGKKHSKKPTNIWATEPAA